MRSRSFMIMFVLCSGAVQAYDTPALAGDRLFEAQELAIEVSGQLRPPERLTEQIYNNLAAIRDAYPDIADITYRAPAVPNEILVALTEQAMEQLHNGQYHALDELNESYGVMEIEPYSSFLTLRFNQVYNTQLLSDIYMNARPKGVRYAQPNYRIGDGSTISAEPPCYTFIRGWGDCPAGCIYHQSWLFCVEDEQVTQVSDSLKAAVGKIEFTRVPGYGSTSSLRGKVYGVDPKKHEVAVYIYVYGWWTKPYWATPLTSIKGNGTWKCDITTSANDSQATEVIAFLIPKGDDAEPGRGQQSFAPRMYEFPYARAVRDPSLRKIDFAGYTWWVKQGDSLGPGPNHFSDSEQDVFVDPDGYLHLRIAQRDGRWHCSEIVGCESLGHGTYIYTIESRLDLLDENVVLGLFTWEDDVVQYNYREIDFEFSRWGDPDDPNCGQYVVQPWDAPGNRYRFPIDYSGKPLTTTHVKKWQADGIYFSSFFGDFSLHPPVEDQIASWDYRGSDNPPEGAENPRINFWLISGRPPVNGQDAEVVIKDFQFLPDLALLVDKCKVKAGKSRKGKPARGSSGFIPPDTIWISGIVENIRTQVIERAEEVRVAIHSLNIPEPCVVRFPVSDKAVKRGKYSCAQTENGSKRLFKLDTKSRKFSFMAKNIDLTGLSCPVSVEIAIGDCIAQVQLDEDIVNGKKPIPIQLMVGVKDTLGVDKRKVKVGKKANTDSLSVKGGFSLKNKPGNKPSMEIRLNGKTAVIPHAAFGYNKKGTYARCKNIKTDIGLVSAKLDIAKCSFSISVRNTALGILKEFGVFLNHLPRDAPENRIVINWL